MFPTGIVSYDDMKRTVCSAVLENLEQELNSIMQDKRTSLKTIPAGGLQKVFAPKLKEVLETANANPAGFDKVMEVQGKVYAVKQILVKNVDMVLQRGEKLKVVNSKADILHAEAVEYKKVATDLQKQMKSQALKTKLLFGSVIVFVVLAGLCLVVGFVSAFTKSQ